MTDIPKSPHAGASACWEAFDAVCYIVYSPRLGTRASQVGPVQALGPLDATCASLCQSRRWLMAKFVLSGPDALTAGEQGSSIFRQAREFLNMPETLPAISSLPTRDKQPMRWVTAPTTSPVLVSQLLYYIPDRESAIGAQPSSFPTSSSSSSLLHTFSQCAHHLTQP